jgi:hypothetical protein
MNPEIKQKLWSVYERKGDLIMISVQKIHPVAVKGQMDCDDHCSHLKSA